MQWTLPQNISEVHNGYDLTHLILNEVSGFFFSYSSTLDRAIRFHEIFRYAISKLNNDQACRFQCLADLNDGGPIWSKPAKQLEEIFAMEEEFSVVKEVRDLLDELSMILRISKKQCSILDPLADFQLYDALFWEQLTDESGNARPSGKKRDGNGNAAALTKVMMLIEMIQNQTKVRVVPLANRNSVIPKDVFVQPSNANAIVERLLRMRMYLDRSVIRRSQL